MTSTPSIDGVLVEWGERLFYPGNRMVKGRTPRLGLFANKAEAIRSRIEATVRRAPQVMVKVTGGGRGMKAIAAHLRYISKCGRLEIEDDRVATVYPAARKTSTAAPKASGCSTLEMCAASSSTAIAPGIACSIRRPACGVVAGSCVPMITSVGRRTAPSVARWSISRIAAQQPT